MDLEKNAHSIKFRGSAPIGRMAVSLSPVYQLVKKIHPVHWGTTIKNANARNICLARNADITIGNLHNLSIKRVLLMFRLILMVFELTNTLIDSLA